MQLRELLGTYLELITLEQVLDQGPQNRLPVTVNHCELSRNIFFEVRRR